MHYELTTCCGALGEAELLRERRAPGAYRRDYYAEIEDEAGTHPVTAAAERRVRAGGEGRERFRRLLALSEHLARSGLPEPARAIWLELEEALHAHWLAVAAEHYNLGVEAGLARGAADAELGTRDLPPRARMQALLEALRRAIDEL